MDDRTHHDPVPFARPIKNGAIIDVHVGCFMYPPSDGRGDTGPLWFAPRGAPVAPGGPQLDATAGGWLMIDIPQMQAILQRN